MLLLFTIRPLFISLLAESKDKDVIAVQFRSGSEAAKDALLERMAAIGQKAELNQACFSVLFCSGFGQKQLLDSVYITP
jgi:hypothetical protein